MSENTKKSTPLPEGVIENKDLQEYNTFRVPVKARYFFRVTDEEKLQQLVKSSFFQEIELVRVLGGGSNVLFTKDFEGLLLWVDVKGKETAEEDEDHIWLSSGGGENWHQFVQYAVENNLGGIENLSLIPGMVGSAPIQNIGAYGVEIKEVFAWLRAVNLNTGEVETFMPEDCDFDYRYSVFKGPLKNQYLVTSVTVKLSKKPVPNLEYKALKEALKEDGIENPDIKQISDAVCRVRQSKLPDPEKRGNAGSFFKNSIIPVEKFQELKQSYPEIPSYPVDETYVKVPSGWLIEKAGMRGVTYGRTGTWPAQALVIVNKGGATGEEIREFSEEIRQKVMEKFGILLENEVNIW